MLEVEQTLDIGLVARILLTTVKQFSTPTNPPEAFCSRTSVTSSRVVGLQPSEGSTEPSSIHCEASELEKDTLRSTASFGVLQLHTCCIATYHS
jgi:hypothetical protein